MSSRVALRDQRVATARARLREATTESQRADAVYAEFEAKLCFDRACWDRAVGPTPAVAARVAVGRLSLEEAVSIERANGDETASELVRGLLPCASDAAGRAAVAALREAFRSSDTMFARSELLPSLTAEDIVARWDTLVSSSMYSMLDGALLAKVGGEGLVDRIGDLLVELRASVRARGAST